MDDVYNFFPILAHNLFTFVREVQGNKTDDWRNKWLYLRSSADFSITFYKLKPDGLYRGAMVYNGFIDSPTATQLLDNKIVALPAMTLGLEFQFLSWMSIEPNLQIRWDYFNAKDYINLAAGVELKFPLKFIHNIMLEPYGAVIVPLPLYIPAPVFNPSPKVAFGGGVQVGIKGGKMGVVFLDANFMYYYGNAGAKNPYADYPNPSIIYYQRYAIGLGLGYKFGAINRK